MLQLTLLDFLDFKSTYLQIHLAGTTARIQLFGFSLVSGKNRKLLQARKHADRSVDAAALSLYSAVDNIYFIRLFSTLGWLWQEFSKIL